MGVDVGEFRGCVFGALEMAISPRQEEVVTIVTSVCGLPENSISPPLWLALDNELEPLLESWWGFLGQRDQRGR